MQVSRISNEAYRAEIRDLIEDIKDNLRLSRLYTITLEMCKRDLREQIEKEEAAERWTRER